MSHVSEDDLVLLHYREDAGEDAGAHVASCEECAARLRALAETLSLATAPDAPERGDDYGAQVWARLRPQLGLPELALESPKVVPFRRPLWPRAAAFAALAAALVLAFLLGRRFPAELLRTKIHETVRLAEAPSHHEPITMSDPYSGGAADYRELATELMKGGR